MRPMPGFTPRTTANVERHAHTAVDANGERVMRLIWHTGAGGWYLLRAACILRLLENTVPMRRDWERGG